MNTTELLCAIRENRCLSEVNDNVYSADTLPVSVNIYPSAFICNTDPARLPGKHWIVFWFEDSNHSECYDSLGRLPGFYHANFESFLQRNTEVCLYNNVSLQTLTADTCGYHVLFYLLMKCQSLSLTQIVDGLSKCESPDKFVVNYVTNNFKCL